MENIEMENNFMQWGESIWAIGNSNSVSIQKLTMLFEHSRAIVKLHLNYLLDIKFLLVMAMTNRRGMDVSAA